MSKFEIKMPKLGESITEGTIITWSIKVGDIVKEDDVLFEVETVKVSAEIPSPVAGTVLEIMYKEGDTVAVGTTVAIIQMDGDEDAPTPPKEETKMEATEEIKEEKVEEVKTTVSEPKNKNNEKKDTEKWFSPVVLELAKQNKLNESELDTIVGTGYLGRLTKKDILQYINKIDSRPNASQTESISNINVTERKEEVKNTVKPKDSDTIVEMDQIRRVTAERMVLSKKTSAHVTTVIEADVTKLVNWRNSAKKQFSEHEGISLTYMPAIVTATTQALLEYPQINASVDGNKIVLKKDINVGIAVALEGWNLIVPVIHNADKLSISGLALAIDDLANKARNKKLKIDNIEGGTFTITNFGSFKNIFGTPIINQPEVAILGVGYIEKKPSVIETPEGDVIAIRHKMYLSLSYDHRIIDGALGGAFLLRIATILENWNTKI